MILVAVLSTFIHSTCGEVDLFHKAFDALFFFSFISFLLQTD